MIKPGKFGHLHLVYYFTVPLSWIRLHDYVLINIKHKKIIPLTIEEFEVWEN